MNVKMKQYPRFETRFYIEFDFEGFFSLPKTHTYFFAQFTHKNKNWKENSKGKICLKPKVLLSLCPNLFNTNETKRFGINLSKSKLQKTNKYTIKENTNNGQ